MNHCDFQRKIKRVELFLHALDALVERLSLSDNFQHKSADLDSNFEPSSGHQNEFSVRLLTSICDRFQNPD